MFVNMIYLLYLYAVRVVDETKKKGEVKVKLLIKVTFIWFRSWRSHFAFPQTFSVSGAS